MVNTVHFRNRERITFDHLVSMKKADATGAVRVLRDGVQHEFHIKLGPVSWLYFQYASRFICLLSCLCYSKTFVFLQLIYM
jgi:putative component of toxin-antitoxin plasmid stabilization module